MRQFSADQRATSAELGIDMYELATSVYFLLPLDVKQTRYAVSNTVTVDHP